VLAQANAALSQATDEQEILSAMASVAMSYQPALSSLTYFLEDESNDLEIAEVMAAADGTGTPLPLSLFPSSTLKRSEFRFMDQVLDNPDTVLYYEDYANDERVDEIAREFGKSFNAGAVILIPLRAIGNILGVASYVWPQATTFDEQLRSKIDALRAPLSSTVASRRAFLDVEQSRSRAETLAEINATLSAAQSEVEILAAVSLYIDETQPSLTTLAYIELDEKDHEPLTSDTVAAWTNGEPDFNSPALGQVYNLRDIPLSNRYLENPSEVIFIEDAQDDERITDVERPLFAQLGINATCLIPLHFGGRWHGILSVNWAEPHTFTELERSILSGMRVPLSSTVASRRDFLNAEKAQQESEIRAVELETVANVSAATTSILDVEELIQNVVDLTQARFDLYHAHIYLVDEASGSLLLAAGAGDAGRMMKQHGHRISLRQSHSVVVQAATGGDGMISDDVTTDVNFLPNPLLPDTKSEMAIPMMVRGQVIGVLDVQSSEPKAFDDEDKQIMTVLADQVAAAIQNARSYELEQEARRTNAALFQISQAINAAASPQEMADAVFHESGMNPYVISIVGYEGFDLDIATTFETLAVAAKADAITQQVGDKFSLEFFPAAYELAKSGISVVGDLDDRDLIDETTAENLRALGYASYIAVNISLGRRSIGTISFFSDVPHEYSASDIRIAENIGDLLASALTRYYLTEQTEQRATELETVATVSAAATTILDVNELLSNVSELTKERFHLYHAHIYLLDSEGKRMMLVAGAGEAGRAMKSAGHSISMTNDNSVVVRAAKTKAGVIVNDVTEAENFMPNPLLPETRSEMAIPLITRGEVIGVLDVQADVQNRFTDEDVRIKTILAEQIAVAVQNARAFEQMELSAERERETSERLREVDRLKSEFLANMSHELRTPLNSIIGYSEVLLDGVDGELTEDMEEDIDAIHNSGKHLLSIINEILDLSKIEAGQMQLDRRPVDLKEFAAEIVRSGQVLVKNKPVDLKLVAEDNVENIYADPIRLRQILWNLVSNALKFTEDGHVYVKLGLFNDKTALITIEDSGIGMDEEGLARIFERFSQVDGSSTRRAGGTGLGLTITKLLVEMHGGQIDVESTEGAGSTFWFTVPLYDEEAEAES